MKYSLIILLSLCTAIAAAVPLRFTADVTSAASHSASAYRGETLDIEATLTDKGRALVLPAGTAATMYWQTNGMGSVWWTAPASVSTGGVIRAVWSPTNDVGAAAYRVFLGVGSPDRNYRANMTLRMIGSPGAEPNALPLPPPSIDFAAVEVANAPWALPYVAGDNIAINGRVISATGGGGGGAVSSVNGQTGTVILNADDVGALSTEDMQIGFLFDSSIFEIYSKHGLDAPIGLKVGNFSIYNGRIYHYEDGAEDPVENTLPSTPGQLVAEDDLEGFARWTSLGSAAYRDADDFATPADEALIYQLIMGSNVVAEVTNYNSRVNPPELRLLQLDSDTHEYFPVWTETNGLERTFARSKAHTDATAAALDAAKADRAWSHTTSGLGADAPDGVTWISTPETVIAGGYEYAKTVTTHGEVWVLTSNGLDMGADTNAFFRVATSDGDVLFSIEKSDSVLVGVDATGIHSSGGIVTISVPVVSDTAPVCYATTNLVAHSWADVSESMPEWMDSAEVSGTSGSWTWTIETSARAAFFQFRVLQEGAAVIRNHAQTDLSSGVVVGNRTFLPVVTGNTLTWEAQ